MLWLYLHFPQLQLDTLEATHHKHDLDKREQALIIFNSQDQQVYQRNLKAKSNKVEIGMGLGTAASLCPELNVIEYQMDQEKTRLNEIAQWLYEWTAEIILYPPNGLALKVTPMLALYGSAQHYTHTIQQALAAQKVSYQHAFAHTPLAARLLAREHVANEAKLSDHYQHHYIRQLQHLAITQFELSDKQTQALTRVGIRQVKQLLAIPRTELGERFGKALLTYLEEVLGERKSTHIFFSPPPHFEMSAPLTHEVKQGPALMFPCKVLLQKLETYCQRRGLFLASLQIQLLKRDQQVTSILLVSAEPCYQAKSWLDLLHLKLESLHLDSPVTDLSVVATQWVEASTQQSSLFDKPGTHLSTQQVISRLEAKLGDQAVKRLHISSDHRPEYASQYGTVHQKTTSSPFTQPHAHSPEPLLRPSLLLEPPRALTEHIQIIHGPERIESAWWDEGKAICRDYFVAVSTHQERIWVFRDRTQNWFVHGYFS